MENNRIVIDLGFAKLVAEKGIDDKYNEIYVGIEKNGVWVQDLAIVREKYHYEDSPNSDLPTVVNEDKFEVLVYANKDDEDYTNKFIIEQYCEDDN